MADLTQAEYERLVVKAHAAPKPKPLPVKDSTPTRQATGTTYAAKGAQGVKPPSLQEIGSSQSSYIVDPVPDLGSPYQRMLTYLKMVRDDASVRVSLRAGKAPVLGAEWFIEPYSSDPQDLAIAEFVEFNLFSGMTSPWTKVLGQILQMYEAEKTVFEPVWELREWAPRKNQAGANRRQYTMLRKLAFRPPSTIGVVTYDDNGGPVSIAQTAINGSGGSKQVTIPIEKLLIFVFEQTSGTGSLDGMSILRSAYKHWWYKNRFYNIDAIQKERHSLGIPDIEIGPGASPADISLAHEMGQSLRSNEKAYIARPQTIKVGFAQVHGNLVNVLESAHHHDDMIMKNIMVQFLNMGMSGEGSGGRAAGASQMDMFLKAMRYVAQTICDGINMYLIPNMVAYNFPTDNFPKINVRGVGEVKDMQMFASALANLASQDLISLDEPTEQWVRQQFDMPRFVGEWQPPTERPTRVQELVQANLADIKGNGSGGATTGDNVTKSSNGGAGNVGKSPSSGAV